MVLKIVVIMDYQVFMLSKQLKKFGSFLFYKCSTSACSIWCKKKFIWNKSNLFWNTGSKGVPFILDTSVSVINRGKIRLAAKIGKKITSGSALDKYGKPTTDPIKALKGVQLPISGFKRFRSSLDG